MKRLLSFDRRNSKDEAMARVCTYHALENKQKLRCSCSKNVYSRQFELMAGGGAMLYFKALRFPFQKAV